MGVHGYVIADRHITLLDEMSKDDIATLGNILCLDIVKSVGVKECIRKDIDEQTRKGIIAQELQAAIGEQVPHIKRWLCSRAISQPLITGEQSVYCGVR